MARPLRIEYPNAFYHVSNKGADKSSIFPGPKFYQAFLDGIAQACARLNVEVHSYCLLKNDYHLLIKTPEGNLSRFMRQVDGLYTQNFQRMKKSQGSVFKSRYKSVLVQPEPYLLPLSRYIHDLPRRGRISPDTHRWSSMGFYLNKEKAEGAWLQRTEVLGQMSPGSRLYSRYSSFVAEGVDDELSHFYGKKNLLSIMGDDKFTKKARAKTSPDKVRGVPQGAQARLRPSMKLIVATVASHYKVEEKSILQAARGPGSKNIPRWVAMYLCQEVGGFTLQVIAQRFRLKRYGTVSTTIGKLKQEFESNPKVRPAIKKLRKALVKSK